MPHALVIERSTSLLIQYLPIVSLRNNVRVCFLRQDAVLIDTYNFTHQKAYIQSIPFPNVTFRNRKFMVCLSCEENGCILPSKIYFWGNLSPIILFTPIHNTNPTRGSDRMEKAFTFKRTLLPLTAPRWTILDFLSWRPIKIYSIVIIDMGITNSRKVDTTKRWL